MSIMAIGKLKYVLLAAPVVVLVGGALAFLQKQDERPLLERAVSVARIPNAHPYYWWLSDSEILRFRDPGQNDWTLVRQDIDTKKVKPGGRIAEIFSESGGRPESIQVAPDGGWLLWTSKDKIVVCKTDGTKRYEYADRGRSLKIWMADGLRWIELEYNAEIFTGAVLHSVIDPKEVQRRPVVPNISCSPKLVNVSRLTPTSDDHILATLWNGPERGIKPAVIVALVLNAHINAVGKFKLNPPRDAARGELVFAPIYGRLAWVVEYQPEWANFTGARPRVGLWVSRMRDWNKHEVGSVESTDGGLRSVQWSPDGERLSFVHDNSVWIVPADG